MNNKNKRFLVITFIVLLVFFLYFGCGAMLVGKFNGRTHESALMGVMSWRWSLTILSFVFGALVSWLLFRKKHSHA
jgi:membrane protein implicated in regulation of membrane protease activity